MMKKMEQLEQVLQILNYFEIQLHFQYGWRHRSLSVLDVPERTSVLTTKKFVICNEHVAGMFQPNFLLSSESHMNLSP